jgi:hypothetical protein
MSLHIPIHPIDSNFKGRSYGDLVATWTNWLFSDQPDYTETTDILFLRGNIGYYQDLQKFYDKTNENAETVFKGTAILVPVICTFLTIGSYYDGSRIESEVGLRNAVNRTVHAGVEAWAKIKLKNGRGEAVNIVDDLLQYYVETPFFKLSVSERSPLRDKIDEPIDPGVYDTVTGGYFLLLRDLDPQTYRIRFGGKGKGNYVTDSVYDVIVLDRERPSPRSIFLQGEDRKKPNTVFKIRQELGI